MYVIENKTESWKTVSHIEAQTIAWKLHKDSEAQIKIFIYDKSKFKKILLAIIEDEIILSHVEGRNYLCLKN